MTAQATQSNDALGKRSSPSSFFAPLQTLGLNLNRPRENRAGDNRSKDDRPKDDRQIAARSKDTGQKDDRSRGDDTRPLDGFSRSNPGRSTAAAGPQPEPAFSSATALRNQSPARDRDLNPGPDPERVRGAISRLVREYQVPGSANPSASSLPASSLPAAAFAEVARRVWAEAEPESTASYRPAPDAYGAEEEGATSAAAVFARVPDSGLDLGSDAGFQSGSESELESRQEARQMAWHDSRLKPRLEARSGPAPGLNEARALAHDAGNLLSALRLYGDLLCFSGVLHERHRHYAVDLKLLSLRSESLIERLLVLAEQVALAERAGLSPALSAIPIPTPVSASPAGSTYESAGDGAADRIAPGMGSRVGSNAAPNFLSRFAADRFGAGRRDPGSEPRFESRFNPGFEPGAEPGLDRGFGPGSDSNLAAGSAAGEPFEAEEISSLADILTRLSGLLGTLAHGALELDAGDQGGLPIVAPAEVVERILVNLVSNAAAAIRGGGAIRIRARLSSASAGESGSPSVPGVEGSAGASQETPLVVLTVDDSGCGISESQLRAALRADSESEVGANRGRFPQDGLPADPLPGASDRRHGQDRRPAGRHGLGLLIVRDLVASTGGRLFIHSRQGTGTRMEIRWRASQAPFQAAGSAGGRGRSDMWNGDLRDRESEVRRRNPRNGSLPNMNLPNGNLHNLNPHNGDPQPAGSRKRDVRRDDPAWVKGAVA